MAVIYISDDLKALLEANSVLIKDEYLTYKLFVDSAVRSKLRNMRVEAGRDEIIAHLKNLENSSQRHLDKKEVRRLREQHAARVARAKQRLDRISD